MITSRSLHLWRTLALAGLTAALLLGTSLPLLANSSHAAPPDAAPLSARAQETPAPTPTYPFEGTYTPPAVPPPLPVPPPAPLIGVDNGALVNILLLGSDSPDNYYRRTDVIVLVSINTVAKTVAMWHIPREMFVYIPTIRWT